MEKKEKSIIKYDPRQHAMLAYCSYKGDTFFWNYCHDSILGSEDTFDGICIEIEEINLEGANLEGVNLNGVNLEGVNLEGANLEGANLDCSNLAGVSFKSANLDKTHFKEATLSDVNFCNTRLWKTHFEGARLSGVNFINASLEQIRFEKARFANSYFEGAIVWGTNLEGAIIVTTDLRGTKFTLVNIDSNTVIWKCKFNKETDFSDVALDVCIIEAELKIALKNNIRRIKWQAWAEYAPSKWKKWYRRGVNIFWLLSDYGSSTRRIIGCFFGLSIVFGTIYWLFAVFPGSHSIVEELRTVTVNNQKYDIDIWQTLARSLYFSIVTMTTLGFGDMHASKAIGWPGYLGYILLSLQVIIGYIILGAIVTRLGILFTSEAPAMDPNSEQKWGLDRAMGELLVIQTIDDD